MIKFYIIVISYLLSSVMAFAAPIKLIGVSMDMSEQQIKQHLTGRGYTCVEETDFYGLPSKKCMSDKTDKMIVHLGVNQGLVNFDCGNFNVCNLSHEEVAEGLIDQGIIGRLDYTFDYNNEDFIEKYCGREDDGDVVCVIKVENDFTKLMGKPVIYLQLQKGTLGAEAPSFN